MVLISILVLLFSFNVNASHKSKKDLNSECRDFGFTFGLAKWKWEKKEWWEWKKKDWNPEGDEFGTSVTGTHNTASWDVGTLDDFGLTGIVVKSGKDHYSQSGSVGVVTEDKPIDYIIFCFKPISCQQSSCGNGNCEAGLGENFATCPQDCTG